MSTPDSPLWRMGSPGSRSSKSGTPSSMREDAEKLQRLYVDWDAILEVKRAEELIRMHEQTARERRQLGRGWMAFVIGMHRRQRTRGARSARLGTAFALLVRSAKADWHRLQELRRLDQVALAKEQRDRRAALFSRFRSWCGSSDRRAADMHRMALAVAAWQLKSPEHGLHKWVPRSRCRALLRKGLQIWASRNARHALIYWLVFAAEVTRKHRVLALGVSTFLHRLQRRLLNGYREQAYKRTRALRLVHAAVNAWAHGRAKRSLNTFRSYVGAKARLQQGLIAGLMGLRARSTRRACNSWMGFAQERSASLRSLRLGVSAFRNGMERRVWDSLVTIAAREKRQRELVQRAAAKMVMQGQSLGFTSWAEATRTRRHKLRVLALGVSAFLHRLQRRLLNGYREQAYKRTRALRLVHAAVNAWAHGRAKRSLNTFRSYVGAKTRLQQGLIAGLMGLRARSTRRACNSWMGFAQERSASLQSLRLGVSAFRNGMDRRVWDSLVTIAAREKRQRELVQRAAAKMVMQGQSLGFTSWTEATRTRRHKLRVLALGVSAFLHRLQRRLLNGYREQAYKRTRALRLVHAAVNAWAHGRAKRSLNTFRSYVGAKARLQQGLIAGLMGLRARSTRRACNSWMGFAQERSASLRSLRLGVSAFRNGMERRVWDSLVTIAAREKRQRELVQRAAAKLSHRGLRFGWMLWVAASTTTRRAILCLSRAVTECERRERRGRRRPWQHWFRIAQVRARLATAMGALALRGRRLGITSWIEMMGDHRRSSQLQQRGVRAHDGALLERERRRAFHSWWALAGSRSRRRELLRLGASAFRSGRLRLGLGSCAMAVALRQLAGELRKTSVSQSRRRGLSIGWMRWVAVASASLRVRLSLSLAAAHWKRCGRRERTAKAWQHWRALCCDSQWWHSVWCEASAVMERRVVERRLHLGFRSWAAVMPGRRHTRQGLVSCVSRGVAAICRRKLCTGMAIWREGTRANQAHEAALGRAGMTFHKRTLGAAHNRWLDHTCNHRRASSFSASLWATAKRGLRHGKQRSTLSSWRAYVAQRAARLRMLRSAAAAFVLRASALACQRALRSWAHARRVVRRLRATTMAITQFKSRMHAKLGQQSRVASFHVWRRAGLSRHGWRLWKCARGLAHTFRAERTRQGIKGAVLLWKDHARRVTSHCAKLALREVDELRYDLEGHARLLMMTSDDDL